MPKDFDIVLADWKDANGLLESLATALLRRGIHLQVHDMGDDNFHVSVGEQRVSKEEYAARYRRRK
jgi:hypothetical protein